MPGEWHGASDSVMPVRHDVHRTFDAALPADETQAELRPGQVLEIDGKLSIWRSARLEDRGHIFWIATVKRILQHDLETLYHTQDCWLYADLHSKMSDHFVDVICQSF